MEKIKLDFLDQLNKKINSSGLYASSSVGLLGTGESISVMAMPGGQEIEFFDGTKDKVYNVQINAKSSAQDNCYNTLVYLSQMLENLEDLPSGNGSYEFQKITIQSPPSLLTYDEAGYWVYILSIGVNITIYKGVDM